MTYWDTSTLLKVYVREHDSAYFLQLAAEDQIVSSAIARTEMFSALYRKELTGDLKSGAADTVYRKFAADAEAGKILMVPYCQDVVTEGERLMRLAFRRPRPVMIRSLDVIHVSSALAGRAKALVATDTRLRAVAALASLRLLP